MIPLLIVDDESIIRETIAAMLRRKYPDQFHIFLASNGQEALSLVASENVELVLADIKMPVMNGLELLHRLHEQQLQCDVIFIIGFASSVGFCTQCHIQGGSDIQQFSHTDGTANLQPEQGAADITGAGEGETALFHDTGQGITGLHLSLKNLRDIRGRHQIAAQILAHRGAGIAGKHIYNFRVFENTQCFFVHK